MNIPLRKLLLFLFISPAAVEYAIADDIGALGYIAPEHGVIEISGKGDATITDIFVKQNQVVKAGDPLVLFSTKASLQSELTQALILLNNHLEVTEKAVKLQESTIRSALQKQRQTIQLLSNYTKLASSSKSSNELQIRKDNVENARVQVEIATATLAKINTEAEAETRLHKFKIRLAKSLLDSATVKAPSDGTILAVMKHSGESNTGMILTMANLDNMIVKSEVFENDLLKISNGMSATIKSNAIPEKLHGAVYLISNEVNSKSKVSNVYIRLEQAYPAHRMIGMEVDVTIHID